MKDWANQIWMVLGIPDRYRRNGGLRATRRLQRKRLALITDMSLKLQICRNSNYFCRGLAPLEVKAEAAWCITQGVHGG